MTKTPKIYMPLKLNEEIQNIFPWTIKSISSKNSGSGFQKPYLSFKHGMPIAMIIEKNKKNKIIYLNNGENKKQNNSRSQKMYDLKIKKGRIEQIPNTDKSRECLYICGCSGVGKSTYCNRYAKFYNKLYPKNPIFIFSKIENDPSLKDLKNVRYVKLDEELITDPITTAELRNSLVIFDDIDTLKNKKIKQAILDLRDDILETGRHKNISILATSHLLNKGKETKDLLNEADTITVYPNSGSYHFIDYCLTNYLGIDKKQMKKIMTLPTRWVTIYKKFPRAVLYQSGAFML